jgi:hypothetical protein
MRRKLLKWNGGREVEIKLNERGRALPLGKPQSLRKMINDQKSEHQQAELLYSI